MKKTLTSIAIINLILLSSSAFASEKVALNYNIISDVANGYVIDSAYTNQINFSLFENESILYCNNQLVNVEENNFSISIVGLKGKQDFVFENGSGEKATYTYYISDEKGYLEDYHFDEMPNSKVKVFIKTVKDVSIIYTDKETKTIKTIEDIVNSLPEKVISNLDEIRLIPAAHQSKAAGITKYSKVTLYKLSSYSKSTIKNIVIHEIAHTWSYKLMQEKILDFSYTKYRQAVNSDKKSPSNYAKQSVKNGDYSEDFAESISFYFINSKSFAKKYPARAEYFTNVLEI